MNLGKAIGAVVSSKLATLNELQTIYGTEDLHNFIEIILVDAHNRAILTEKP